MDRRTVWAILLMMVIAITPAIFIKRPPRPAPGAGTAADSSAPAPAAPSGSAAPAGSAASGDSVPAVSVPRDSLRAPADSATVATRARVVHVTSPLYTYGISTTGGRLVEARLHRYRSIAPADSGRTAELLPQDSRLLGLTVVLERDTIPLDGWTFTASADSLAAGGEPLRLTATRGAAGVELTYRFAPDD